MWFDEAVRQTHRWVALAFLVTVVATTAALVAGGSALAWVVYTPLLPLAVLAVSGAYLFARPYTARRRVAARAGAGR